MKNMFKKLTFSLIALLSFNMAEAQNTEEAKAEFPFSLGADFVSAYVWRGTKYTGPSIQPTIEYSKGGFAIGTWGSFSFMNSGTDGTNFVSFNELDTYASYTFGFGLGFGLTDYYYQGTKAFDFADTTGSHALEANLNYTLKDFSISANYVINDTHAGGAGSKGGDVYFEAGYSFKWLDIFVGAGDGWHTKDGNFNVSNVGLGVSKDIKITENFSLPVFGQVIVNPDKEEYDLIFGISL